MRILALSVGWCMAIVANAQVRVEPLHWWSNFPMDTIELMVYAADMQQRELKVGPEVEVLKITQLQNPNYRFVQIHIPSFGRDTSCRIALSGASDTVFYDFALYAWKPANCAGIDPSDLIYLITPDRFANGDRTNDEVAGMREGLSPKDPYGRHGGDLAGVMQQWDYLDQLGVGALWLNPVLENNHKRWSYHGYAITDFYQVDPRFGSNEQYRELAQKAHDRGMKIIMDQVLNHCGIDHPWVADLPDSAWFNHGLEFHSTNHFHGAQIDPYSGSAESEAFTKGWFVPSMPDLNQQLPQVARYLIQHSIWWVAYLGLDGIRIDTYPYADHAFMLQWSCAIRSSFPALFLVGEEWSTNPLVLSSWQAGGVLTPEESCLNSLLDFPIQESVRQALTEEESWGKGLYRLHAMLGNDMVYGDASQLVIFPDNHDMDRFFRQMDGDMDRFKMGMGIFYTLRGIPQILYGTELAKTNVEAGHHGQIRSDMPFDTLGQLMALDKTQQEALTYLRELGQWRRGSKAIHKGALRHYLPWDGVYVYFRFTHSDTVMVVVNKNKKKVDLPLERFSEMLNGKTRYRSHDGSLEGELSKGICVPGMSTSILELDPVQ